MLQQFGEYIMPDSCEMGEWQLVDAQRWRSPAAGSRSEARAEAGGSQVQCFVGPLRVPIQLATPVCSTTTSGTEE